MRTVARMVLCQKRPQKLLVARSSTKSHARKLRGAFKIVHIDQGSNAQSLKLAGQVIQLCFVPLLSWQIEGKAVCSSQPHPLIHG